MPVTQDNRFIKIETPLGKDKLLLVRFTCRETLGRLYDMDAEVASEDYKVDFDKILGQAVTISMMRGDGNWRHFSGIVSRFVQTAGQGDFARYEMRIVPWLWLLTRTADCRIFQNKSIPDVLKAVFDLYAFADNKPNLSGTYNPIEYQVQYRETDFNFVSRLMEQAGIYYYFEHGEKGAHKLHLVDAPSAHNPVAGYEKIDWAGTTGRALDKQTISDWVYERSVQPAKYATTDFDFKVPGKQLLSPSENPPKHAQKTFEIYDYPGEYVEKADGEAIAKIRLQELQSSYETATGSGNSRGIAVGSLFTLNNPPREDWKDKKWLVTEAVHRAVSDPFFAQRGGQQDEYSCRFGVVESTVLWRPARTTPKPTIPGPQTAIVCGPKDKEIHVDEFGRVKVKFHWDRESKADESSSCFIRVSQHWAGKQWGTMMIPRIGQEVIVEFLEGDPDRPIITGRVYNGECKVPYALPDFDTVSTWKSLSSPDGGGFNEIRFQDKKDSETIFMHAQKDFELRILNDRHETVKRDRHLIVERDRVEHVKQDQQATIDRDHVSKVGRDLSAKVAGKEMREVTGSQSIKVGGDVAQVYESAASTTVTGQYSIQADTVVIEGKTNVTLKVGGNWIAIESDGVKIKASKIEFESSGDIASTASANFTVDATQNITATGTAGVTVESPATMDVKGATTTVKGDGMLTLKGGMVMIN